MTLLLAALGSGSYRDNQFLKRNRNEGLITAGQIGVWQSSSQGSSSTYASSTIISSTMPSVIGTVSYGTSISTGIDSMTSCSNDPSIGIDSADAHESHGISTILPSPAACDMLYPPVTGRFESSDNGLPVEEIGLPE